MDHWQAVVASITFVGVIALIMTEWLHLTIAALLGALLLVFCNIMTLTEAMGYIGRGHQTLALFLGVMILVRVYEPTKVFEYIATKILILARGSGKLLLLGIVGITTPICAVIPNATTVILLAPLIPPLAQDIGVDFVPLLILMVFIANSAGLLTLVGDPATFIVGDAVNISFIDYLLKLSPGGVIAILTLVAMLPWLFPVTWKTQLPSQDISKIPTPQIQHPRAVIMGGIIATLMLVFFVIGETLPVPISPAAVALLGGALALLVSTRSDIETVQHVLRDVDWSTLIFFMSTFVLIGGLEKTGVISQFSGLLAVILGQNIALGSLVLLLVVGLISSVIPNIPLVVAMVPLLKEYLVQVGMVGTEVLDPEFAGQLPESVLPLFYAMMFGATLGGNGTLVGASSNIVAAGISDLHGKPIPFHMFLRYGIPVMLCQLFTAALFVTLRFLL